MVKAKKIIKARNPYKNRELEKDIENIIYGVWVICALKMKNDDFWNFEV